jgi:hypothetical protein
MILIQQGVDRIWRLYRLVLRFVPFYERRQDLQPVSIGSPGFRVHEPFDFLKRGRWSALILIGRICIEQPHTRETLMRSYAWCVPTNRI